MTQFLKLKDTRRMLYSLILFAGLIPAGGCTDIVERSWSEEVALDDGRVITIERYVKFKETNSLAGDAYSAKELESTLSFPEDQANLPIWNIPLLPLLLYSDRVANEWVIVATSGSCDAWYERGSPRPPYWEFRLRSGDWKEVPLSPSSMRRSSNLFILYERPLPGRALTLDVKRRVMAANDVAPMYRSIISDVTWGCTAPTSR